MRLLIDIGNTRIKGALASDAGLQLLPAVPYLEQGVAAALDTWAVPDGITDCWIASVGHQDLHSVIQAWASAHTSQPARFAESVARACGVTNAYAVPSNLGVDRWLAVIAAHHRGRGPAMVVSAGTAATIDAVDGAGRHLGGLITPGLSTQRRAMLDHTQVRANTLEKAPELLGQSTDACVTFGTLHALAGYIERVHARLAGGDAGWRCLLTGGDAELLHSLLPGEWELAPNLVLEGLARLAAESGD